MTKEEILKRSREENHAQDEWDRRIAAKSNMVAGLGILVFLLILMAIRCFKGQSVQDIIAIYFCYLALNTTYQAMITKERKLTINAVGYWLCALAWLVSFILVG